MNELALFAGAGGGILGGKLLGWRTVCAVEINAYRARRLMQRQNEGYLPPFPIWDDVCTFDGRPWMGLIDVVSGGFPCQDISIAGKGAGIDGQQSGLWREMARIIGEVRPRYAFVENSQYLVRRGLDRVLGDLAEMGYDAKWGIVSAENAGAPHERKRIWILAYTSEIGRSEQDTVQSGHNQEWNGAAPQQAGRSIQSISLSSSSHVSNPQKSGEGRLSIRPGRQDEAETNPAGLCQKVPNSNGKHDDPGRHGASDVSQQQKAKISGDNRIFQNTNGHGCDEVEQAEYRAEARNEQQHQALQPGQLGWPPESGLGRVVDGMANRIQRIEAIGDGQVPRVVALAWRILSGMK